MEKCGRRCGAALEDRTVPIPEKATTPPGRRGRPPSADRAADRPDGPGEQRVEAVERALSILEAFADGTPRLSLAEVAGRTGLYPSTVLRLAASLDRFGYLHRGADGLFRLGPTPLRLGLLYRDAFDLADHVRPALARLVERTGETAAFYVREGDRRVCLYRHHSPRLIRHHVEEGAALPLDRGASAHVLVAFTGGVGATYDAVRSRGLYVSLGERDPETAAVAAPVFGRERRFLGALGVTGPRGRFEGENRDRLAAALVEEAGLLSRAIGGGGGG
jgi:DNA-binding IclR family transcriptional regulator